MKIFRPRQEQEGAEQPPVMLFLPGAGGGHPRDPMALKKARYYIDAMGYFDNFVMISPAQSTKWKTPPFFFLLEFCAALKHAYPQQRLVMMGFSKGAWWGSLFLAARAGLFDAAVLLGGYSTPMRTQQAGSCLQPGWSCSVWPVWLCAGVGLQEL